MLTLTKKSINPINFVDAIHCEIIDDNGKVLASFDALKYPNGISVVDGTIKKNTEIDIYEYI